MIYFILPVCFFIGFIAAVFMDWFDRRNFAALKALQTKSTGQGIKK